MPATVTNAFVRRYERDVHLDFQRNGAKLMHTVRSKNNIGAESTDFPRIGTGVATTKGRHGNVTPMNAAHSTVQCSLSDFYAPDYVDKLDEEKMNIDDRAALVTTGARALGRKADSLVINTLTSTSNTVAVSTTGLTRAKVLEAFEGLGGNDAFEEGEMFAICDFEGWADLLTLDEFADADKITQADLPWLKKGIVGRNWLGTFWMPHSGLSELTSGTTHQAFWWNKNAVGLATGTDVTADISWVPEKVSFLVNNWMSMGTCMIEDNGVYEIDFVGTSA